MIKFFHINGAETCAKTAAIALMYWYSCLKRRKPPNPDEIEWYGRVGLHVGRGYDFPTQGPDFLALCIAACERTLNESPEIVDDIAYEEQCRRFMLWLEKKKQIRKLTHDGELDPPAEVEQG